MPVSIRRAQEHSFKTRAIGLPGPQKIPLEGSGQVKYVQESYQRMLILDAS